MPKREDMEDLSSHSDDVLSALFSQFLKREYSSLETTPNLFMCEKKKNHNYDKLMDNPESFTSASLIIAYVTEPSPWLLTVTMAPIAMTKASDTWPGGVLWEVRISWRMFWIFKGKLLILSLMKSQVPLWEFYRPDSSFNSAGRGCRGR